MQLTPEEQSRLVPIGWKNQALPDDAPADARLVRVVAQHRAGYRIHDGVEEVTAQPAARFLKAGLEPADRPAVGDFVLVTPGAPPHIERILPRRTELRRAASGERYQHQVIATNVDTVFVLAGLDGDFNPARIERYLLLIDGSGARAVIVLTKADTDVDAQASVARVRERIAAPVEIHAINAKSADSVAPLLTHLGPGETAVLVGSSGVGKSTLTNTLLGEPRQATAAVRDHDSRGRHTTTHRALIPLPSGACLIDTPGMRELKLTGNEEFGEGGQFADIEGLAEACRFADCGHSNEPGCAVREALEDGRLDAARWENYCKLVAEKAAAADSLEEQLRRRGEARRHPEKHHPRDRYE
jgi:ribosome biogenesis GTPase